MNNFDLTFIASISDKKSVQEMAKYGEIISTFSELDRNYSDITAIEGFESLNYKEKLKELRDNSLILLVNLDVETNPMHFKAFYNNFKKSVNKEDFNNDLKVIFIDNNNNNDKCNALDSSEYLLRNLKNLDDESIAQKLKMAVSQGKVEDLELDKENICSGSTPKMPLEEEIVDSEEIKGFKNGLKSKINKNKREMAGLTPNISNSNPKDKPMEDPSETLSLNLGLLDDYESPSPKEETIIQPEITMFEETIDLNEGSQENSEEFSVNTSPDFEIIIDDNQFEPITLNNEFQVEMEMGTEPKIEPIVVLEEPEEAKGNNEMEYLIPEEKNERVESKLEEKPKFEKEEVRGEMASLVSKLLINLKNKRETLVFNDDVSAIEAIYVKDIDKFSTMRFLKRNINDPVYVCEIINESTIPLEMVTLSEDSSILGAALEVTDKELGVFLYVDPFKKSKIKIVKVFDRKIVPQNNAKVDFDINEVSDFEEIVKLLILSDKKYPGLKKKIFLVNKSIE